jgi:hypothetical protein
MLGRMIVLLAVGRVLFLLVNKLGWPLVGDPQHSEPGRTEHDKQECDIEERDRKLGPDAHGNPSNHFRQPQYTKRAPVCPNRIVGQFHI